MFLLTVFVVDDLAALRRDRGRLQRADHRLLPLRARRRRCSRCCWCVGSAMRRRSVVRRCSGSPLWAALLASGVDPVVAGLASGCPPGVLAEPRRARAGDRAGPRVPRAADPGAGARGRDQRLTADAVAERPAAELLPPVDELRDRPAVRAGQRGHRAVDGDFLRRARTPRRSRSASSSATWSASRSPSWRVVGWSTRLEPRPDAAAGRLGGGAGQRHDRRHRLHRRAADRRPRLRRAPSSTEAKLGVLSAAAVLAPVLTWLVLPADRAAARPRRQARALLGDVGLIHDLIARGRPRARPHPRAGRRARSRVDRVRRLRVPVLRAGRAGVRDLLADADLRYVWRHLPLTDVHPRAQLAAEAAEAAAAQGAFWEMHDLLLAHQDDLRPADLVALRRRARAWTSSASATTCTRHVHAGPGRAGRRVGRPQRRLRHPDVLRQRPAPLRRLRRRDARGRRPGRAGAGAGGPLTSHGPPRV